MGQTTILIVVLIAMTIATPTILTPGTSHAALRDFSAQPLAPGICGLTWEATEPLPPGGFEIQRRIGESDVAFETVATCNPAMLEYIDRFTAGIDAPLTYRIIEKGIEGNGSSREYRTRNGANLLPDGEMKHLSASEQAPELAGLSISVSPPWSVRIVPDTSPRQGASCLEFATSDRNAVATFNISSRRLIVTPRSTYHFHWWTTESVHGTSFAGGQGYALTRGGEKSFYEKTASLYVQQAVRQDEWVGSSGEPRLQRDIRFVYLTIRGQGKYHPRPIRVADIGIVDRDIELLAASDLDELPAAARAAAGRHPDLGLSEQVNALSKTIDDKRTALRSLALQDFDAFLASRADLCDAIRELNRLAVVFRLAEAE